MSVPCSSVNSTFLFESYVSGSPSTPFALTTYAHFFEPGPPATPLFSKHCALFKTRLLQPIDSRPLSHSLQNNGGYTPASNQTHSSFAVSEPSFTGNALLLPE